MNIYIVDDASFVRMICRYHLTKAGHKIVGESHDGETALAEILATQPDCVLVDLSLPNKSGAEIMREVNAQYPHIQFVVVSALDEIILRDTAPDVIYSSFIQKPFEGSDLIKAFNDIQASLPRRKHG